MTIASQPISLLTVVCHVIASGEMGTRVSPRFVLHSEKQV